MADHRYFKSKIFNLQSEKDFSAVSLSLFRWQAEHNEVYRTWIEYLGVNSSTVKNVRDIPFLPIAFFKEFAVKTEVYDPEVIYTSSGTAGSGTSKHYVRDIGLYEENFMRIFSDFYGPADQYCILALLPSYLERKGSSLIHMADILIRESGHSQSGFYLNDLEELSRILKYNAGHNIPTILLGVTFALLDLAEQFPMDLRQTIVMETGGMKGRRKELIRSEVHDILKKAFRLKYIHSEYGMTELLSQAYSRGDGRFYTPPWMKVCIRDTDDPFSSSAQGKTGGINIIDLANIDSCAFIETQDLGRSYKDGSFEVMGRFDHSDIRGCNLMVV